MTVRPSIQRTAAVLAIPVLGSAPAGCGTDVISRLLPPEPRAGGAGLSADPPTGSDGGPDVGPATGPDVGPYGGLDTWPARADGTSQDTRLRVTRSPCGRGPGDWVKPDVRRSVVSAGIWRPSLALPHHGGTPSTTRPAGAGDIRPGPPRPKPRPPRSPAPEPPPRRSAHPVAGSQGSRSTKGGATEHKTSEAGIENAGSWSPSTYSAALPAGNAYALAVSQGRGKKEPAPGHRDRDAMHPATARPE